MYAKRRHNQKICNAFTFLKEKTRVLTCFKGICDYLSVKVHTNQARLSGERPFI